MSIQSGMVAPLLMLVACTVPPQAQEEPVILPVFIVEETKSAETPEIAPKLKLEKKIEKKPEDRKADKVCPPIEGETDNQRILRKLDCLIERD